MVEGYRSEEKLCRVGIACLPDQESPPLLVSPQVRHDVDIEQILGIRDAGEDRGGNDAKEEDSGDRSGSKARG